MTSSQLLIAVKGAQERKAAHWSPPLLRESAPDKNSLFWPRDVLHEPLVFKLPPQLAHLDTLGPMLDTQANTLLYA